MSLIPCTDPCIYQQEGRCTLSRAASRGNPSPQKPCIHYLPRDHSEQDRQSFPDIPDRDHL
ncbi:MAG: hypothetical protein SOR61_08715 [Evtepia sp.]|uniref:hypothetical protein n=1 Tax=Evtepia sp. TaxID=2773933 RepID=UPI002A766577|nr:hypothetical protein [Evtepia sp.]MDY3015237.1 hypothetical protein [Evtepia sp.]